MVKSVIKTIEQKLEELEQSQKSLKKAVNGDSGAPSLTSSVSSGDLFADGSSERRIVKKFSHLGPDVRFPPGCSLYLCVALTCG